MAQKPLMQRIYDMLQIMTEDGLLDQLAGSMHPDDINRICDEVQAIAKGGTPQTASNDERKPDEPFEIHRTFVASTCHVTKADADFLQENATSSGMVPLVVYEKGEYGWWLYLGDVLGTADTTTCVSEPLAGLIRLARDHGCVWLMLDADGPVYDGLPVYDWARQDD